MNRDRQELPEIDSVPGPRLVLDTGQRCTICLAPLFGDPASITINKSVSLTSDGPPVTISFPVCTVCVDPVEPHQLRMERWKIARPGRDLSLDVFDHRQQIQQLIVSGIDSYYYCRND
jgi:hypothetical protein